MSSYNVKNYTEQGGDIIHIGGELVIDKEASVQGLPEFPIAVLPMTEEGETEITFRTLFDLVNVQGKVVFFNRSVSASDADYSNIFLVKRVAYFPEQVNSEYSVDLCAFGNGYDTASGGPANETVIFGISSV